MNEFEQWWASANTRLTDLPKAQAKFIWDAAQNKQAEPVAQPYAYVYEFDSGMFGIHRSFSSNERNGSKPSRVVPVYTHPAPAVAQGEPRFPFAGFDPNFCPGSNPENPQEAPAVAQCRGYALLGTGNYLLNHSDDFHPKLGVELIITLAAEKDKEGNRQIGETRDNPNHRQPIQPEDMVVRIGFLNERGLFALENQLAVIRKQFFADHPAPAVAQPPAEVVRELVEAANQVFAIMRESEGIAGYHMNGAVAEWDSLTEVWNLEAALKSAKEHGL